MNYRPGHHANVLALGQVDVRVRPGVTPVCPRRVAIRARSIDDEIHSGLPRCIRGHRFESATFKKMIRYRGEKKKFANLAELQPGRARQKS